jgi:hypothetical protein
MVKPVVEPVVKPVVKPFVGGRTLVARLVR